MVVLVVHVADRNHTGSLAMVIDAVGVPTKTNLFNYVKILDDDHLIFISFKSN